MEQERVPSSAEKTEAQSMPRQPYAPPKATFVPLKLEERLLACDKAGLPGQECMGGLMLS